MTEATSSAAQGIEDYNPFADDNLSEPTTTVRKFTRSFAAVFRLSSSLQSAAEVAPPPVARPAPPTYPAVIQPEPSSYPSPPAYNDTVGFFLCWIQLLCD